MFIAVWMIYGFTVSNITLSYFSDEHYVNYIQYFLWFLFYYVKIKDSTLLFVTRNAYEQYNLLINQSEWLL